MTSRAVPLLVSLLAVAVSTAAGQASASAPAPADLDVLRPVLETRSSFDDEASGDADADDPAVWVHPRRTGRSVVLGTLKNGGIDVYDLRARRLQHLAAPAAPGPDLESGRFNNVDVAPRTPWGPIAVVTDRGRDRLRIFTIDRRGAAAPGRVVRDVTAADAPRLFSPSEAAVQEQRTGYGLAVRRHRGATYVAASRRSTSTIGMFRLHRDGRAIGYRTTAKLRLPTAFRLGDGSRWSPCTDPGEGPQVEGMVVDGVRDVLYAAQEDVGVWRIPLDGAGFGRPRLIERVREFGRDASYDEELEECVVTGPRVADSGRHLSADAEGLTFETRRGRPVELMVSSQGDSTFSVFTLSGRFLRSFRVGPAPRLGIDGDQHSDGAALVSRPMGPRFPQGLLVVQDGENDPGVDPERENTNFKYVPWRR